MAKITRTDAEWAYMLSKDGWSYDALRETWRREKDGKVEVGGLRDGTFTSRTFSLHYPCDPGNWRDSDDAMGAFKEAVKPDEPINHEQEAKLHGFATKPDVGYPAPPDLDWLNEVRTALRDQFAMHALQGMLARSANWSPKELALRSYEYADAMMVAREMKR